MKGYEKNKAYKTGRKQLGLIEVQRGAGKMMAWGSIGNSAPYKLEPKVVVGRSKLLNNCFFFSFSFFLVRFS